MGADLKKYRKQIKNNEFSKIIKPKTILVDNINKKISDIKTQKNYIKNNNSSNVYAKKILEIKNFDLSRVKVPKEFDNLDLEKIKEKAEDYLNQRLEIQNNLKKLTLQTLDSKIKFLNDKKDQLEKKVIVDSGLSKTNVKTSKVIKKLKDEPITRIEGIGQQYDKKLNQNNIFSVYDLLVNLQDNESIKQLSRSTGLSESLLQRWKNNAIFFQIPGVSEEYADLIVESGVKSLSDLAGRDPEKLLEVIKKTNANKNLVRMVPALNSVINWIASANVLQDMKLHDQ